jgi:hypothetical protein
MSRAEVEAILGPPGDYATAPFPMYDTTQEWKGNNAVIRIGFDSANVATYKQYLKGPRVDQELFDNLLWHAEDLCHRWFP